MAEQHGSSRKDGLLFNKIAGAILGSLLTVMVVRLVGEALYHPQHLASPAYAIEVPKDADHGTAAVKAVDFNTLLASADSSKGARLSKKCAACHTLTKGGKNATGPNLWGVVGRPRASKSGFNYSSAMKAFGGSWSFDELSKFIENPKGYIKGTAMSFAGMRKPQDRANLIAYLRTLSDSPLPLPVTQTAASPESASPEEEGQDEETPADH